MAVIIAHIDIGTLGMEGAFEAMATGEVDLNWANEHHDLWLEGQLGEERLLLDPDNHQQFRWNEPVAMRMLVCITGDASYQPTVRKGFCQ